MTARLILSFGFFSGMAALLLFAGGEQSYGQTKAEKKAIKQMEKQAKEVAKQEFNGQEAEVLRKAYLLMSAANANYKGHRGKALESIKDACEILDKRIIAKGTAQQEAETLRQDAIVAYLKTSRELSGKEREPQVISDAQLYQAGQLLTQLRPVLVKNNQKKILAHVDKALEELKEALKIR